MGSRDRCVHDPGWPRVMASPWSTRPGTIDSDYRGEVMVALVNLGDAAFVVERGMRIAQLLVAPVPRVTWSEVDELPATARGAGGFGHTGSQ